MSASIILAMGSFQVRHVGLEQIDGVHDPILLGAILGTHVGETLDGLGELADADFQDVGNEPTGVDSSTCVGESA